MILVTCAAVHPIAALVCTAAAIAALALGDLLTAPMGFTEQDLPAVWCCGFGILILVLAALGKAGLLSPLIVVGLLSLCGVRVLLERRRLWRWLSAPFARWTAPEISGSPITGVCVFFLFLLTGCSLLMMLAPPTAFDVLAYHFPLAQHYARTQAVQPTPLIPQSYYPQGAELLMTLGFALGQPAAAQMLMAFVGVLFLWMLFRVGRSCGVHSPACIVGTAIAAAYPFLHWSLGVAKNDLLMALFELGALYGFLQWQAGRGHRWILLGSFLLGEAAGVKHVVLFAMAGLAPLWLYAWVRERMPWRAITVAIVLFAAGGLFWHAQTWVLTGNPLYPEGARQTAQMLPQQQHPENQLRRWVTLPWYLMFQGKQAFESASPNPMGMFLFLFAPVLLATLLLGRWNAPRQAVLVFGLIYLLAWADVLSALRYAIVPFSLLALAGGAGIVRLLSSASREGRVFVAVGCAYSFLFSLLVVLCIEVNSLQPAYLMGRISAREYLEQALPTTPSLFRLAGAHPGASVFGVANCSRYYAPNPLRFSCLLCGGGCDPKDFTASLAASRPQFAIVPAGSAFQPFVDAVRTQFGAVPVAADGHFVTLMLPPNSSPKR